MSSLEEDTELRDLLVQKLEANGTLGKLRAQLRASVFLALEEQQNAVKNKTPLLNEKLKRFVDTDEGLVCGNLVREFMAHFNMTPSLSIFEPECGTDHSMSRNDLARDLGLQAESSSADVPLLALLVQKLQSRDARQKTSAVPSLNLGNLEKNSTMKTVAPKPFDNVASKRANVGVTAEATDDDFFSTSASSSSTKINLGSGFNKNSSSTMAKQAATDWSFQKPSDPFGASKTLAASPVTPPASSSLLGSLPALGRGATLPPMSAAGSLQPLFGKSAITVDVQRTKLVDVPDKLFEDGAGAGTNSDDDDRSLADSLPSGRQSDRQLKQALNGFSAKANIPNMTNKAPKKNEMPATAVKNDSKRTSTDDEVTEEIPEDIEVEELSQHSAVSF